MTGSLKSAKLFTVTETQNAKMAVEKSTDLPLQMSDKHKSSYQTASTQQKRIEKIIVEPLFDCSAVNTPVYHEDKAIVLD